MKIRRTVYVVLKNIILFILIKYELDLAFWLFKINKAGWSGLLLVIAVIGIDILLTYLLLNRRLIEWDRKIAEKIFRIYDYK